MGSFPNPVQAGVMCSYPFHTSINALIIIILTYLNCLSLPTDNGFFEDNDPHLLTGIFPESSVINLDAIDTQ